MPDMRGRAGAVRATTSVVSKLGKAMERSNGKSTGPSTKCEIRDGAGAVAYAGFARPAVVSQHPSGDSGCDPSAGSAAAEGDLEADCGPEYVGLLRRP